MATEALFLLQKLMKGGNDMLGIWENTAYSDITQIDYLEYMYKNVPGLITRNVISKNNIFWERFNTHERLINKNRYNECKDVFTSLNTFLNKKGGRQVNNIKCLNALYIDIDCYKLGFTQDQVMMNLNENYFNSKIPVPTFVINSGRGLYLIWKINEDRNALPRWNKVQHYLFEQCKELGADPQALDAARILRVPGTINTRNNNKVNIIEFNNVKYTLYSIMQEFDINKKKQLKTYKYGQATDKQRKTAIFIASKLGMELPDFQNYNETWNFIKCNKEKAKGIIENDKKILFFGKQKGILKGYIEDLFTLFKSRKGEDCSREYGLFLCRLWSLELSGDYEYGLKKTLELNRSMDVPFSEKYVKTRTKSAEKKIKAGSTYKYTIKKIIEILNITKEEQEKLMYLCSTNKTIKKEQNRRAYLARLNKIGEKTKKAKVEERRVIVKELLDQKKTTEEICKILNISIRTFARDKAAINGTIIEVIDEPVIDIQQQIECIENEKQSIDKNVIKCNKSLHIFMPFIQLYYYIKKTLRVFRLYFWILFGYDTF